MGGGGGWGWGAAPRDPPLGPPLSTMQKYTKEVSFE